MNHSAKKKVSRAVKWVGFLGCLLLAVSPLLCTIAPLLLFPILREPLILAYYGQFLVYASFATIFTIHSAMKYLDTLFTPETPRTRYTSVTV